MVTCGVSEVSTKQTCGPDAGHTPGDGSGSAAAERGRASAGRREMGRRSPARRRMMLRSRSAVPPAAQGIPRMGDEARAIIRPLSAVVPVIGGGPRVASGGPVASASVRQVLRILAIGYAAVLLALGTQPSHPERSSVGFLQTVLHLTAGEAAIFRAFVDLAGNVAVTVPLGLLVMTAWRIPAIGMLSGLVVGGACELVQLFEPGRVASLTDVLTNTAGGILGAALVVGPAASGPFRRIRAAADDR